MTETFEETHADTPIFRSSVGDKINKSVTSVGHDIADMSEMANIV